jgi:DNA-binding transcriptional LysR family regulator
MDLVDLQVFKSVVDEGGIVKAARKLHRVPSSVTTRIKQLETSMGVTLFHRDRQRLHLSPTGEVLLGYAERLIQLSGEARAVVSGGMPRGVLKLGALESTTASRLPRLLADFHRRYPDVWLELVTGTNDDLVNKVADRRLDAAFTAEAPAARALQHIPVFPERLIVISSPGHRPIRRPRDVEGSTLLAFPTGCAYRRVLQRWLGRDSLSTLRVLERTPTMRSSPASLPAPASRWSPSQCSTPCRARRCFGIRSRRRRPASRHRWSGATARFPRPCWRCAR